MAKVQFSTGLLENLSKIGNTPGSIYFAIKEEKDNLNQVISSNGAIYFDKDEKTRINITKDAERLMPSIERSYICSSDKWGRFLTQRDENLPWSCQLRIYVHSDESKEILQFMDVNVLNTVEDFMIYGADTTKNANSSYSGIKKIRVDKHSLSLFTDSTITRIIDVYPINLQNCYLEPVLQRSLTSEEGAITVCSNKLWGTDLVEEQKELATQSIENPDFLVSKDNIALTGYGLFGLNQNSEIEPISVYSLAQASNTSNMSTIRVYNTHGIDYKMGLFYNDSEKYSMPGTNSNISVSEAFNLIDFRYSDNCFRINCADSNFTLTPRKPVYLRGMIENGLFYLKPFDEEYCIISGYLHNESFYTDINYEEKIDTLNQCLYYDLNTKKYYIFTGYSFRIFNEDVDELPKFKKVWTQEPVEDKEIVYWFVGYPYYNKAYPNSGYQINLSQSNLMLVPSENNTMTEYAPNATIAKLSHSLTIGEHVFNGTKDVYVPIYGGERV